MATDTVIRRARRAGVQRDEQVEALLLPHVADDDPRGPHAQRLLHLLLIEVRPVNRHMARELYEIHRAFVSKFVGADELRGQLQGLCPPRSPLSRPSRRGWAGETMTVSLPGRRRSRSGPPPPDP
jgi:hypothetical protein